MFYQKKQYVLQRKDARSRSFSGSRLKIKSFYWSQKKYA